jgi:hypothetical protein
MNDQIANQIASYRTRLDCLDQPAHLAIWQNQFPQAFTTKVAAARAATQTLTDTAARQSAPITGSAADKRREEKELEDTAYTLARALVACCTDAGDLTQAAKYDFPLSSWRRLRDEALIQRARQLEADVIALANGPSSGDANNYGINLAAIATLTKDADDYAAFIVAPQNTLAARSELTASLPQLSRATAILFDQIEDLLPQFSNTPLGAIFVNHYRASTQIIDRGHGPLTTPPTPPVLP